MEYKFQMDWHVGNILPEHMNLFIAQSSCWIVTTDKKILLVSKDGEHWTVPAGHTEKSDENYFVTAIREVKEETGVDISSFKKDMKVLGYYVITAYDVISNKLVNKDIQIRLFLELACDSKDLIFQPQERETQVDKIQYASAFTLSEAISRVSWLNGSGDLEEIKKQIDFS